MEIITRSFQQITDMEAEVHEVFEEDDDVYYAELERQIILLLTDDGDEEDEKISGCIKRRTGQNRVTNRFSVSSSELGLWGSEKEIPVPSWLVDVWRLRSSGTGTGVFIPKVVGTGQHWRTNTNTRKRNKSRQRREF